VIVNGTVLDKQGRKMSKSLKNSVDPLEVMSKFGADATRWYFFSAVAIGNDYRFDLPAVQDVIRRFLLILWNTYGFFTNYARLDQLLVSLTQLPAPFMPFVSETIYQNLAASKGGQPESVHLSDWPVAAPDWRDDELRKQMSVVRRLVATGLAARNTAAIKVRQPLLAVTIGEKPLKPELEAILLEELN